ncbi:MAG: hypothetical protein NC833_02185 [Candidatus Omnitrophica bacterium]|nr:hypothetical protein [Candidatus Omnitrophota bacterium]
MNKCFICNSKNHILVKLINEKKENYYIYICKNCFERFNISTFKNKKNLKKEKCPVCGYTISEFNEYKFLGCDFCYEYFYEEILNYLKKIHINIIYKGKYPKKFKFQREKVKKFFKSGNFLIDSIKTK